MKIAIYYAVISGILLLVAAGCSGYSPDMTGTVVDAETRKPIEGAVVLVEWTKRVGIGDYHTESVKVVEVVSDKQGRFEVAGILRPFIDPPDMTIYKKDYVAWSNRTIFPDMKERKNFRWRNGSVYELEHFKAEYSHDKHVSFIRGAINSTVAHEKKKRILEAFDWETVLAFQERTKAKTSIK